MKEIIIAILSFVICYGLGVVIYHSGCPQAGEGIAIISCAGLILWGFSFAVVHSQAAL